MQFKPRYICDATGSTLICIETKKVIRTLTPNMGLTSIGGALNVNSFGGIHAR